MWKITFYFSSGYSFDTYLFFLDSRLVTHSLVISWDFPKASTGFKWTSQYMVETLFNSFNKSGSCQLDPVMVTRAGRRPVVLNVRRNSSVEDLSQISQCPLSSQGKETTSIVFFFWSRWAFGKICLLLMKRLNSNISIFQWIT